MSFDVCDFVVSLFRDAVDWNDPARPWRAPEEACAAFKASICPRSLGYFADDLKRCEARVRAFQRRGRMADSDVEDEARRAWGTQLGAGQARFFRKVPAGRLRSFDGALLQRVAENFVAWDPLVRLVESGGGSNAGVRELMTLTANSLRKRGVPRDRAEDALQAALLTAIETRDNPYSGYVYESPWPAWLITTAMYIARGMREWVPVPVPGPDNEPFEMPRELRGEDVRRWSERCALAVATFEEKKVADRAWRIARSQIRGEHDNDAALAAAISAELDVPCTPAMIQLTRLSLLTRLEVFRYLDSGSEAPLLEWIPWSSRDIPSIRKLEASARVAATDPDLGWALISFTVFEDDDYRARWMPLARRMMRRPNADYERRFNDWMKSPKAKDARRLRNRAVRDGYGWAVPACWYLRVLRLESPPPIADILRCPESAALAAEL